MAQHGRKWSLLQQQQAVPGRSARQMKDRYLYVLDPSLDRSALSAEVRLRGCLDAYPSGGGAIHSCTRPMHDYATILSLSLPRRPQTTKLPHQLQTQEVSTLVDACEGHQAAFGSIRWSKLVSGQFPGRSKFRLQQVWNWYHKVRE